MVDRFDPTRGLQNLVEYSVERVGQAGRFIDKEVIQPFYGALKDVGDFLEDLFLPDLPEEIEGTLVNKRSNIASIPVIYGQRKVGGTVVFIGTSGTKNEYLNIVLVLCEGEIESIDEVWLDDYKLSDARYSGLVTVGTDPSTSRTRYGYVGTTTQSAYQDLIDQNIGWTSDHTLSGLAYLPIRLLWTDDREKNPFRGIPKITCEIRGKRVYDVRDATTKYSINNALCLYDYLTNSLYGKGLSSGEIDSSSVIVAADYCDVKMDQRINNPTGYLVNQTGHAVGDTTVVVDSGTNTILQGDSFTIGTDTTRYLVLGYTGSTVTYAPAARTAFADNAALDFQMEYFECSGSIDTSRTVFENTKKILQSFRCMLPWVQGTYRFLIEKDETPTFTFDLDNIVSGISYSKGSKKSRANRVKARFANPSRSWREDMVVYDSPANRTEDGNLLLEKTVTLPFETNPYRALHIANTSLKRTREDISVSFTATIEAMQVEIGDIVYLTHESLGWTNKLFRVVDLTLNADGNVSVSLIEHDTTIYDRTIPASFDVTPDTNLPDPFGAVLPPSGLTLHSGGEHLVVTEAGSVIPQLHISWTAPNDPYVVGYECEYKLTTAPSTDWLPAPQSSDLNTTEAYVSPVFLKSYDVRVRSVNSMGKVSTWIEDSAVAIGYSDAPNTPVGVQLSNWTHRNLASSAMNMSSSSYGNNTYLVTGESSYYDASSSTGYYYYLEYSPNLLNWQIQSSANKLEAPSSGNGRINNSYFDGTRFWLVGGEASVESLFAYSTDAETWTLPVHPDTTVKMAGVAYSGSRWVAVGASDGTQAYLITATALNTWTQITGLVNVGFLDVVYGNGLFVAVGEADGTSSYIITSSDGTTWTRRTVSLTETLKSITYGNGLFVALGNNNTIVISSDGITWTNATIPSGLTGSGLQRIDFGNNVFVAASSYTIPGTSTQSVELLTSVDGVIWTVKKLGNNGVLVGNVILDVSYNSNSFMLAGYAEGTGFGSNFVTSMFAT